MAFGQQEAQRVQETAINVNSTEWKALQGSTVLPLRFAVEIFNRSDKKIFYTYDSSKSVRETRALGVSETKVEPAHNAMTLYGRCAAGTARVIAVEWGH